MLNTSSSRTNKNERVQKEVCTEFYNKKYHFNLHGKHIHEGIQN